MMINAPSTCRAPCHPTAWAEAVHRPPGQKTEQRSHQELAERVPGGHLGARPAEVAHHEVVKERQAVEREPDDREQRQERRRGDLRLRTPNAHKFWRFSSFTAWSTARAVRAM